MRKDFYIDPVNKTVNFIFDYDDSIRAEIKSIDFNTRFNPELKEWIVPVHQYSRGRIKRIIFDHGFKQIAPPSESEVVVDYEKSDIDYEYLEKMAAFCNFTYTPRKYQLEYLSYAMDHGNVINGDDVGLGKTFESIIYTEVTNSFPCLVVVPASVKYNWAKEWLLITKGRRSVAVIESKETKKRKNNWDADVVIINYDIIGKKQGRGTSLRFEELSSDYRMVIFDEAHFLKNTKSQRASAAARLVKGDKRIQLLTGTATMNKPIELWNLLGLVKMRDEIVDDWRQFVHRYCGGYKGKFGWVTDGATNTLELNRKLRENGYIRREKEDVLTDLPKIIDQIIHIPITNLRDYEKAENDFLEYIKESEGQEALEKAMEAEHLVRLGKLRRMSSEGKQKAVELYLKEFKENGIKMVVFGIHAEQLQYLSEKFKCPLIDGKVSAKKKQQIKEDWIKSDDIFLFGNMQSMGTGVDGLQHVCSNMVIYELPWRPSDLTQVIGRLHRSGQRVPPNITYLLSQENIDMEMWGMLEEKQEVTEAVNKGIDVRKRGSGMKNVIRRIQKKKK